ncbi:MAG: lysophospholipid acyltransferase family protein [Desulfobacula sp.]|nr:lysophospholipid acyltransferase family protein [Desulfobacula sp.]
MSEKRMYALIKLVVLLLSSLPRQWLLSFSDALGVIWYKIDKRHRDVVLSNVCNAYPDRFSGDQAQRFAKKIFKHTTGILFDIIWSYSKQPDDLFKHFCVKGIDNVEKAKQKGKGVILLAGHLGNFELMSAGVAMAGLNPYGLYRQLDFRPLERLLKETRERFGTTMIPLRRASKKVETLLRQGEVVGTLLDQSVDWYKGAYVEYYGRLACTNSGLAKLVLKTRCAVVPMFIIKENENYILEFLPEIPLEVTGDPIKDVENNTQNFVSTIEFMVRKCPEQYFWVHNRWKTKTYCQIDDK